MEKPSQKKPIQARDSQDPQRQSTVFKRARAGSRYKLELEDELVQGKAEDLFREVIQAFESGATEVVLDLRRVQYLDTAALQSLVRIFKYAQGKSGLKFVLLAVEGRLLDILKTCRFDKFMTITQDESVVKDDWVQG